MTTEQEQQKWEIRQMVAEVSREIRLPYHWALACFRSTLRSIHMATVRFGPIDLSVFGVEGITRTEVHKEDSAVGVVP